MASRRRLSLYREILPGQPHSESAIPGMSRTFPQELLRSCDGCVAVEETLRARNKLPGESMDIHVRSEGMARTVDRFDGFCSFGNSTFLCSSHGVVPHVPRFRVLVRFAIPILTKKDRPHCRLAFQ